MNLIVFLIKHCGKVTLAVFGALLISVIFLNGSVSANTLLTDFNIDLAIEIGDLEEDFKDESENIEKGRFVTYLIQIQNSGSVTHHDLVVLMDVPDYMKYVPGTTYKIENGLTTLIGDINDSGPFEVGYTIDNFSSGSNMEFIAQFQVDTDILDDEVYTVAWASLFDKYSSMPLVSNLVENKISGEAIPALQVTVEAMPEPESKVNAGFQIIYNYTIKNLGGAPETNVGIVTYLPENTTCIDSCGTIEFGILGPNEFVNVIMIVEVNADYGVANKIENIGFDYFGKITGKIENRKPIIHLIDSTATAEDGDFVVDIVQKPNIVLNSADGITARYDGADLTETLYTLTYEGRQKSNTFPKLSIEGRTKRTNSHCGDYYYPQIWGASTYAYNSSNSGGGCDNIFECPPISSPIVFNVDTTLPENAPKLLFTINTTSYSYGVSAEVNSYMKDGDSIPIPSVFTQSRAVENGDMGIVSTSVEADVTEDLYRYKEVDSVLWCTYQTCSKKSCTTHEVFRPVYEWQQVNSVPFTISDDDNTDIAVYTSTAWLKTSGGHLGTNDQFTNDIYTDANYVDLGVPEFSDHLTPSSIYTPPGETNSQYMIFGKTGTGTFKSEFGDAWNVEGTEFPFLQRGDVYDRTENPRNYYEDMFVREKFGEVREGELASNLSGTVNLGNNIIWKNTGDIFIGQEGVNDQVVFAGGKSRIYTDGDVYVNANIKYSSSQGGSYSDITSVRIDARNIYVSGEVTDLEIMLMARGTFKSGQSKKQLRILGDVIANNSVWGREPLLEFAPTEFNKPSEYIIEDMRKYVLPPPGDTEIPDDHNVWRQVNPATGEVMDAY